MCFFKNLISIPLKLGTGQMDQGFISKQWKLWRETDKSHIRLQNTVKAFYMFHVLLKTDGASSAKAGDENKKMHL